MAKKQDSRSVAARVLKDVLGGHSLSEASARLLPQLEDAKDRGLAQELCYGVMRWHPQLEALTRQLLKKPLKPKDFDIQALLFIGLYQLLYLRVADHAAVHESAGAAERLGKRWAVGLVNGVLRAFQRQQETLLAKVDADPAVRYRMPAWLLQRIQQHWPQNWQETVEALNSRPPMSLRVNQQLGSRDDYLQKLADNGIGAQIIEATRSGIVLDQPLDVGSLPGFDDGLVSVQDGGAQLAAELLGPKPGEMVLDACAAPGGKSGHLLELAQELRLTALDVDGRRLLRVQENLERLGLSATLAEGDAAAPSGEWSAQTYDRILLDVPCSATGVIRRHPDIKYLRREEDIAPLVVLQRSILTAIWSLLKPGGRLLYATCSILPEENEQQVTAFLAAEESARECGIDAPWGEACAPGRQIRPGDSSMDGFYYACLQKREK
ncbi:MAG: 16S rRNA methyltransferase [Gammaproteobacteria bacterium (ex Lamellibrachia satsuma)]|nr:MAG: 16S rRNA (cytosine(967)-C(5))-methyltransferase RsmB [Gammaproteobacteria bacterium (ex Lamellibrachia satsuma)]RRS34388.1 MAG: 16S rRNA methyltransferase [Gammaproteobacteria bacterium (ex Lamellibrachia satsuma)]RRS36424.1 MAG: 16S rRNA methyltransferase [Gammaproteobacteria bacterium (ex Lamellibrachia satsuma)]